MKTLLALLFCIISANSFSKITPAPKHSPSETDCIAFVVWAEARGEPAKGRRAIIDIIESRMRIRNKSACEVVMEKGQFSVYNKRTKIEVPIEGIVDYIMLEEMPRVLPEDAQYFHAKYVHPGWKRRKVAAIGNHLFFI